MEGYDIIFDKTIMPWIEQHFCREFGNCGGGMTLPEAIEEVAMHLELLAQQYRTYTHENVQELLEDVHSD
ncbi:MAG: hypothetical protein ACOC80_10160 [Petrotogales bacterium]